MPLETDYWIKIGLFGYDMSNIIRDCGGSKECEKIYEDYDGWSMGAALRFPYTTAIDQYENFGACWDNYCFGLWAKYDYEAQRYYSTEISFKYSGTVGTSRPRVTRTPNVLFTDFYNNYMYSFYDSAFNYIWYYANEPRGAVFSRWLNVNLGDSKYEIGDKATVWQFTSLSTDENPKSRITLALASSPILPTLALALGCSSLL